jgi:hypothetical protein
VWRHTSAHPNAVSDPPRPCSEVKRSSKRRLPNTCGRLWCGCTCARSQTLLNYSAIRAYLLDHSRAYLDSADQDGGIGQLGTVIRTYPMPGVYAVQFDAESEPHVVAGPLLADVPSHTQSVQGTMTFQTELGRALGARHLLVARYNILITSLPPRPDSGS